MTENPATLTGDVTMSLPEFDDPPADPVSLLRAWLDAAIHRGVREPFAVTLATSDRLGATTSRTVAVKGVEGDGVVFTTNRCSVKGRQLDENPWASITFYWRETLQQINLAGPVEIVPDARCDELFAERPIEARATSAVSRQSSVLSDETELSQRAIEAAAGTVARPDDWIGYRLVPASIEFWHGRTDRLHRRLHYTYVNGVWTFQRLQP